MQCTVIVTKHEGEFRTVHSMENGFWSISSLDSQVHICSQLWFISQLHSIFVLDEQLANSPFNSPFNSLVHVSNSVGHLFDRLSSISLLSSVKLHKEQFPVGREQVHCFIGYWHFHSHLQWSLLSAVHRHKEV